MRRLIAPLLALLVLAGFPARLPAMEASDAPDARPLAVGAPFPDLPLAGADASGGEPALPTTLGAVKADVLIVEIFSMYCPFCQKDAPAANALHALIEKRGLAGRVAMLGIGAGNSAMEVDIFRKKFGVTFPLFPDPDFAAHKLAGGVGTPFYYVLRRGPGGGFTVALAHLGTIGPPDAFLDRIAALTGL